MKKKLIIIAMLVALATTGCADVIELSDEENGIIAEYIAGSLLKHDVNYKDAIKYTKLELTETPKPKVTAKPVETDKPSSDKNNSNSSNNKSTETVSGFSFSELIGNDNLKIKQTKCKMGSSYGTNYSLITAGSGKKLLVVYFDIKNNTSNNVKLNLMDKSVSYSLYKGKKSYGTALLTIAKGDIQYFNEAIPANDKKQAILIFEVKSSFKSNGAVIKASLNNKEADIKLK